MEAPLRRLDVFNFVPTKQSTLLQNDPHGGIFVVESIGCEDGMTNSGCGSESRAQPPVTSPSSFFNLDRVMAREHRGGAGFYYRVRLDSVTNRSNLEVS